MRPRLEYPPGQQPKRRVQIQWEYAEQAAVVAWARGSSGRWKELELLYSVANGRGTHIVTRMKMVREGVNAGIPDLVLPVARGPYHGFYGEMKAINKITGVRGDHSDAQKEKIFRLRAEGYYVCSAWTAEEMKAHIMAYLKLGPFKQRRAA